MEPIETRSDSRCKLIAASPSEVYAAMGDPARVARTFDTAEHYERIAGFVASANEQNLERLAAEVRKGHENRH